MRAVEVLSIQSSVAYGHVGNSAAVFPLQRLGHEVWPVLTVHFSNHTGYGAWRGPLLDPADVREVIAGIDDRGVLGRVRRGAVRLPGRPGGGRGDPRRGRPGEGAQPGRRLLLRPGDGRRRPRACSSGPGIPEFMRDTVVPRGRHPHARTTSSSTSSPARRPRRWPRCWPPSTPCATAGPRDVLVTSVLHADTPGRLARRRRGLRRRRLGGHHSPAADLAQRLRRRHRRALPRAPAPRPARPAAALERTTSSVFAILEATLAAGTREIQLVAAQDAIADPPPTFPARQLR